MQKIGCIISGVLQKNGAKLPELRLSAAAEVAGNHPGMIRRVI